MLIFLMLRNHFSSNFWTETSPDSEGMKQLSKDRLGAFSFPKVTKNKITEALHRIRNGRDSVLPPPEASWSKTSGNSVYWGRCSAPARSSQHFPLSCGTAVEDTEPIYISTEVAAWVWIGEAADTPQSLKDTGDARGSFQLQPEVSHCRMLRGRASPVYFNTDKGRACGPLHLVVLAPYSYVTCAAAHFN